jgi:hypothetical protein
VHSPLLERGSERSLGFRITHPFAWKNRDTRNPPRKKLMVSALDAKHCTLSYIASRKLTAPDLVHGALVFAVFLAIGAGMRLLRGPVLAFVLRRTAR